MTVRRKKYILYLPDAEFISYTKLSDLGTAEEKFIIFTGWFFD